MDIKGLDYNTQREKLIFPEYGREIQSMVDYAMTLTDREERQRCAEAIVAVMNQMHPQTKENADYDRKLWDQLALMSGFQLDIDYPYDISTAAKIAAKPQPMGYPMKDIPVRHYGNMIFELFEKLKSMEPGEERDELARVTANQMKRNLEQWSHGSADDEKIASDLARFTDGAIQLDLATFKFDTTKVKELQTTNNKKKKK